VIVYTKEQAQAELPPISDKSLLDSVNVALSLYLNSHWSLKNSIDAAYIQHKPQSKRSIERLMRDVIPEEVFVSRSNIGWTAHRSKSILEGMAAKRAAKQKCTI